MCLCFLQSVKQDVGKHVGSRTKHSSYSVPCFTVCCQYERQAQALQASYSLDFISGVLSCSHSYCFTDSQLLEDTSNMRIVDSVLCHFTETVAMLNFTHFSSGEFSLGFVDLPGERLSFLTQDEAFLTPLLLALNLKWQVTVNSYIYSTIIEKLKKKTSHPWAKEANEYSLCECMAETHLYFQKWPGLVCINSILF